MHISERRAGQIANRIHAARAAKQLTLRQALDQLERISHSLSTTQFIKLMDLQSHARNNPHLIDE
jgi:hypothetical protein